MSVLAAQAPVSKAFSQYDDAIAARIETGKLKLPVLPLAIQRIMEMNSNPEFDVQALSELIHQDQTLAGHVLRVCNSSIYAGTYKISSLRQAISRLGGHAMVKIAVSVTMQGEIFQVVRFREEIQEIWRHAFASGLYAQEIAIVRGAPDPQMYMCGLLHQVGKPVLLQTIVSVARQLDSVLDESEVARLLAVYHTRVGTLLATTWKLPATIVDACRFYEQPGDAPTPATEVYVTHLASRLADGLLEGQVPACDPALLDAIGLTAAHWATLQSKEEEIKAMMGAISV
ncbi:MAG: HDOD domain-containing protein [Bacteroidota bacterium]